LALAQAHETKQRLMAAHGLDEANFEIVVLSTKGDRITNQALAAIGGKGLFTAELEEQLLLGELDIAVHSSKDMATKLPDGLEIAAYLPREDIRDAFVGRTSARLLELPHGAMVGTASLRRQALVRKLRPDLNVKIFRGLVDTRLRKLAEGDADATLLAFAGLKRLGKPEVATEGAICVEARRDRGDIATLLAPINHADTFSAVTSERAFLEVLDGSCRTPIAGYTKIDGGRLELRGMVLTADGQTDFATVIEGPVSEAAQLGRRAGVQIRDKAGTQFFENWG
jgi:hydroxymethylbilane synthase